jgi:membrane fusion protein, copper/silver efflux system
MKLRLLMSIIFFSLVVGGLLQATEPQHKHKTEVQNLETIYTCPMHPEIRKKEAGLCPICGMTLMPEQATEEDQKLLSPKPTSPKPDHSKMDHSKAAHANPPPKPEKKAEKKGAVVYTCPMHPQIRENRPGSCPICGMDLVPVEPVSESLPESSVKGFATIQITPEQQWFIGVKTTPVVKEILTRRLRTVGTVAFDPDLYVAQKEYLEALKAGQASGLSTFVGAARRKLTLLGMTEKQIEALGRQKKIDESLFLTEGTGKAWIYSTIYESERPLLRKGLKIEVQTVGHPQKVYIGEIDAIIPVVDPMNRTITVRSEIIDSINLLKPDMFVDVFIEIPLGEELTIPKNAVLQTGLRNIVMVTKGNGIFEPREVILGKESDEKYQVVSGLEEHETVVTSANFLIDSESQIRGAFSTSGGADQGGHQHGQ